MVEREKALDMALKQIEKQFGAGALMKLGEEQQQQVAAIPTGALSLDLALGIGGMPRGRVVELFGKEGSGKCVTADTRIWTDQGLETVEELFARCGQKASATTRVTDISDHNVRVVNENGDLESVTALTHNYRRQVFRIRLRSGRTVEVTENHPLRVINEDGFIVWRKGGEIDAGDTVVSAAFGAVESASGGDLSEDEAVLIGYLVAEGSLNYESSIRFTNWDPEVSGEFTKLMEQLFGARVSNYDDKEFAVQGTALRAQFAEDYGLDYVNAADKKVPPCIRTAGHKLQRAFLSALFEGDGWIDGSSTIGFASASKQLASEVQLLLYGFGIPATLAAKYNADYDRDYWTVTINPAAAHRFLDEIGFRSARRASQVEDNFRKSDYAPRFENEDRYTFEEVVAVEDGGVKPTFDIVVPGTNSFLANGMLSHNTTVALHTIAEAQKLGGIAAFIDAEHALDPSYAKALGVDVDELLVSQPDTGEQALEITDMLVRSSAVDIVVIDSVAALVPKAEIEGEMGDTHVGLQARLMSQAMRKLSGSINKSKTCVIFINQLRMKIGVMFGNPETTPGGRALKFYSSVRLDVRRIEGLKDGSEYVGSRVRVRVKKNKVAPPFKQAEFDLMYGTGISKEGSIIDVGVEAGVIKKAGAWYSYEDDQLGQGRENARQFLQEHDDIAREIEKKAKEELGITPKAAEGEEADEDADEGDDGDEGED